MPQFKDKFGTLLASCRAFYDASPELQEFAKWPEDLQSGSVLPRPVPAISQIKSWVATSPIHMALQAVSDDAAWQQSYSESQVGRQFLDSYGFIELYGPYGHYVSSTSRAFIGYWGGGLHYDWHRHEAEEIYGIVSGQALFRAEGQPDTLLGPGATRRHSSLQSHAFSMTNGPLLAFVLWRGSGMAQPTSSANIFSQHPRNAESQRSG